MQILKKKTNKQVWPKVNFASYFHDKWLVWVGSGGFLLVQMLCFRDFFPTDEHWCRKMSSDLAVQARPPRTIQLHLLSSAHRGLIWNRDWKQNRCNTGWILAWVEIMLQALLFGELTLVCKTAQMLLPLNASHSKHCGGRLSRSILELSEEFHFHFECCSGIYAQRCFLSGEKHTRNVLEKT